MLSEEESIYLMLYRDPPKMVKRTELFHGKFPLESRYGVLQKRYARCGEHNIINIKATSIPYRRRDGRRTKRYQTWPQQIPRLGEMVPLDPRLDDVVHPVPSRNADRCGV
jgi:hypothetical protein